MFPIGEKKNEIKKHTVKDTAQETKQYINNTEVVLEQRNIRNRFSFFYLSREAFMKGKKEEDIKGTALECGTFGAFHEGKKSRE